MTPNIIIWHLRGKKEIVEIVCELAKSGRIYTFVISRTEVFMGMHLKQEVATKEFFSSLGTCIINESIADLAGKYIRKYRNNSITLEIPDTLIAATATLNNLILVTLNTNHYSMEDLRLYFGRESSFLPLISQKN